MLNFQAMRLLHRHGENDYIPMAEHGVANHDPEREMLRGETPFLHVMSGNTGARRLYEHMGFETYREVVVRVVSPV